MFGLEFRRRRSGSSFQGPAARARLAAVLAAAHLAGAGLARAEGAIPILVYHRFDPATPGDTTVRTSTFEGQLAWLDRHGYRIVPLSQALAELEGEARPAAGPEVVITADDGHESVYTQLYPLILKRRIPVTLFIYPSAISNAAYALTWAQLKQMQASGLVDIQSHTYWHPNFRIEQRRLKPADYRAFVDLQLKKSKSTLEARVGRPVTLLAWPFGIVDADLEAAARRDGYEAAFAYEGGPAKAGDDLLALPRIPVADADRGQRFGDELQAIRKAAHPRAAR